MSAASVCLDDEEKFREIISLMIAPLVGAAVMLVNLRRADLRAKR
jgi:hypothetical protein